MTAQSCRNCGHDSSVARWLGVTLSSSGRTALRSGTVAPYRIRALRTIRTFGLAINSATESKTAGLVVEPGRCELMYATV
jgi:hypothetical protein